MVTEEVNSRLEALWETIKGHAEDIHQLRTDLAQEQQANAANTRTLGLLTSWLLKLVATLKTDSTSGADYPQDSDTHFHAILPQSFVLPALDTSGYAPPENAGVLIPGTGTGEPPVPPRYETRPGAMHRGSSGLPAVKGSHPS